MLPVFALLTLLAARAILGLVPFIRRPRAIEQLLQLVERRRAHRASLPARHDEPERPIELGHFFLDERARDFLR